MFTFGAAAGRATAGRGAARTPAVSNHQQRGRRRGREGEEKEESVPRQQRRRARTRAGSEAVNRSLYRTHLAATEAVRQARRRGRRTIWAAIYGAILGLLVDVALRIRVAAHVQGRRFSLCVSYSCGRRAGWLLRKHAGCEGSLSSPRPLIGCSPAKSKQADTRSAVRRPTAPPSKPPSRVAVFSSQLPSDLPSADASEHRVEKGLPTTGTRVPLIHHVKPEHCRHPPHARS